MHSRGTFPGQTEDPRQSESSLAQMGTPRARHTGLALFSEPSSNISVCGSERRRVAASEATGQTSDCSYNHRGIGSQSVGGKCPAWRSGWEVSGPKLGWRDACGSEQRTCRSRRSGWTGSGWHAPPDSVRRTDDVRNTGRSVSPKGCECPLYSDGEVTLACELMGTAPCSLSHPIRRSRTAHRAGPLSQRRLCI